MKLALRVFFTLRELKESRYHRTQQEADFPPDVTPEAAYAELYHKYGRVTDSEQIDPLTGSKIAPKQYAEIHHHSMVDLENERGVIESDKIIPQDLFDGVTLKNCLQDSPNLISKKFAKRRKRSER